MNSFILRPLIWLALGSAMMGMALPNSSWALDARNLEQIQSSLGFSAYYAANKNIQQKIKIAVFDNGFDGYEKFLGKTLPANTIYVDGKVPANGPESAHGRFMAEILFALMTNNNNKPELAPELYLFKVNGFTNLKAAIDEALRLKVDLVLHSMVREYGSNFDGQGFINSEVNRAINGGITWVNAAGNFGKTTFNLTNFTTHPDGWINLPGPNQSLPIRCENPKSESKTCLLRLVLSWNDFKNDSEVGTDKDLDLAVTDNMLNILQSSKLTQTIKDNPAPGYSKYPREIVELELKPGRYFIRISNRSQNFSTKDKLRLTADGDFISFEKFDSAENLLNPADNPRVITVGASDSDRSSRSISLGKPDVLAPSLIEISDKEAYLGSSNSAAIFAAGVGLVKIYSPHIDRTQLLKTLTAPYRKNIVGQGLPLTSLGFGPVAHSAENPGQLCFDVVDVHSALPNYIQTILKQGGVFVNSTNGLRLVTPFDPIRIASNLHRVRADDIILITPQGFVLRTRRDLLTIPGDWAEVFQLPAQSSTCSLPAAWFQYAPVVGNGQSFHMPSPTSLNPVK